MGRKVVLIVEADGSKAGAALHLLRSADYVVEAQPTVVAALEWLAAHRGPPEDCRLVLCPVRTALLDGFGLLTQVQRNFADVGVILTGAGDDVGLVRKAFRMGATDVLSEPLCGEGALGGGLAFAVAHGLEWVETRKQTAGYTLHLEQLMAKRATQLRTLRKDLELWCDMTIATMGELLDLRDEETEGHSKRVTMYASELGIAMGLKPAELKTIVRGAYLHDIGKIAVPDAILRKPGRLTEEEMEVMQRHCEHGYGIVRKIPSLSDAAEIVYTHQEAFDGGGYPRRLKGEEIPLGARIFAVADTLDAITSDRPYRQASSFDQAIEEIERCSGSQFDPEVVETFLRLPKVTWEMLREEIEHRDRTFGAESTALTAA